ncbi:MAG TPA: hypothetical protein VKT78_14385, partial [Fimbriimonadaceae bacterium]|nr:hypothetical protein [Fimbriimonadaceae bacterium]
MSVVVVAAGSCDVPVDRVLVFRDDAVILAGSGLVGFDDPTISRHRRQLHPNLGSNLRPES